MKTHLVMVIAALAASVLADTPSKQYQVEMKPGVLDEFISVKTPEGKVFRNVKVVRVTYDKIGIVHDDGAASLVLADMPGEVRARFGYDKAKAFHGNVVVSPAGGPGSAPRTVASAAPSSAATSYMPQYGIPFDVQHGIKAAAAKEWPGDYSMQVYYIENQTKAFRQLQGIATGGMPGVPPDVLYGIAMNAHKSWGTDYSMCVWKIESEVKAWKKLKGVQ